MECPYCESELEYDSVFGRLFSHQDQKVLGDIYRCPKGRENDGSCDSECFHVAGAFYTYREGNTDLQEGYPC